MSNEENLKSWKTGQSGNPSGKPKGIEHSSTRLKRLLVLTENLKNPITGEFEGFTVAEQMDLQQILKAKNGDTRSYSIILDRLEGKPKESMDIKRSGVVQFVNDLPRPVKDSHC